MDLVCICLYEYINTFKYVIILNMNAHRLEYTWDELQLCYYERQIYLWTYSKFLTQGNSDFY